MINLDLLIKRIEILEDKMKKHEQYKTEILTGVGFKDINMREILNNMPEFLRTSHLVTLGIYKNRDTASWARKKGQGPDWIKDKHRTIYPKKSVIKFLETNFIDGSIPRKKK